MLQRKYLEYEIDPETKDKRSEARPKKQPT